MVHKKAEGAYHRIEKLMKQMPGFLSPRRGLPLLLIPEYSGINKKQRIPDRSKTAHRKLPVKCFLTIDDKERIRAQFFVPPGDCTLINSVCSLLTGERVEENLDLTLLNYTFKLYLALLKA